MHTWHHDRTSISALSGLFCACTPPCTRAQLSRPPGMCGCLSHPLDLPVKYLASLSFHGLPQPELQPGVSCAVGFPCLLFRLLVCTIMCLSVEFSHFLLQTSEFLLYAKLLVLMACPAIIKLLVTDLGKDY